MIGRSELIALLQIPSEREKYLFELSSKAKFENFGSTVHLRGLIEMSNICAKDCYYCGIRASAGGVFRYNLSDRDVIDAAMYAYNNRYGSVAMQSGELVSSQNSSRVERLVKEIKQLTNNELGITLSLGDQSIDTYKRWRDAGADRYLLRIESSNEELYNQIHPQDSLHSYSRRVESLESLKKCNYQVGTGVMIGIPNQTIENLADDLIFFRDMDIDMCGMGPYLENEYSLLSTPQLSQQERFDLTLRMIATLRIMMPTINIAAATSLQAIDPFGREKALQIGANVIMPNITPTTVRKNYKLYENKPISEDCLDIQERTLFERLEDAGCEVQFGEQGNSKHYINRNNIK